MRAAVIVACLAIALAGCSLGGTGERRMLANGQAFEAVGEDAYGEGRQQLLAGNYGLAVRQLRAALRSRPGSPEILNALAIAYEQLGRRDISQGYFAQALAADPTSVQTLNNVARSLMKGGSIALASSYLQRAATLAPQNPVVRSNLQLIADRVPPGPAARAAAIATQDNDPRVWIERASPQIQTLVTRPPIHAEHAVAIDEERLPLVSFVSVSFEAEPETASAPVVVEARVREAPPAAASGPNFSAALAIANGNGRTRMAARVGAYLEGQGWSAARLLNADHFHYARTAIAYRAGFASEAQDLASSLPVKAEIYESAELAGDILLRIGKDLLPFDQHITH